MKNMKKIVVIALVAVSLLAIALPALAAPAPVNPSTANGSKRGPFSLGSFQQTNTSVFKASGYDHRTIVIDFRDSVRASGGGTLQVWIYRAFEGQTRNDWVLAGSGIVNVLSTGVNGNSVITAPIPALQDVEGVPVFYVEVYNSGTSSVNWCYRPSTRN